MDRSRVGSLGITTRTLQTTVPNGTLQTTMGAAFASRIGLRDIKGVQTVKAFERQGVKGTVSPMLWQTKVDKELSGAADVVFAGSALRDQSQQLTQVLDEGVRSANATANQALSIRVAEMQEAIARLEDQLSDVNLEKERLEASRVSLVQALTEKQRPLEITQNCLIRRSQRPATELVRDNPEVSLENELEDLKTAVQYLQTELASTDADLRAVRRQKLQIERDLENKRRALNIDMSCVALRTSSDMTMTA
mmetsp:Transcript_32548/g.52742  ORF Transcript_32548/g.52742 Transcript_32548/m.52742 type:complete len:251 (+) Transcript_32548:193-945(+)|eukprot:CAMPEP_0184645924 /NCGR_PEP_ID=MMETSP0308-20130426/2537_1 /TAXON_ID=38269 /ORGANISM="Gloeochaete witrockiana, Strain SAG 46.84" /LENGTH=250 /DNA_ID=CAMNT_0027075455 /DNA_START=181 /DNA_END=933 /DNA_ORIENTATION=-